MEGLCASTGRRAWGTGGPSPRILFLHGSCLPPRHHPRPETRVSPRPLAWLSHKPSRSRGLCGPRGQNAAVLQGTALVAPRVNAGGGGTKAQGPHPERRQPSSKASARASPYPSLSFSDIPVPSPRLDPDTRKKKKKKIPVLLKLAPWPRQRLFPHKALCRPPGPSTPHTLRGGCLPPGHWPLTPSSCWSGGLVGPSSQAPRSQPCVLGTCVLGFTG